MKSKDIWTEPAPADGVAVAVERVPLGPASLAIEHDFHRMFSTANRA
jgi:hypothetical protein